MKDIHEWSTTDTAYAMGFVVVMFIVISIFTYLASKIDNSPNEDKREPINLDKHEEEISK